MFKVCFKCNNDKSLDMFYKHSGMADGYLNKCKECTKKDVKKHYYANFLAQRIYEKKRFNDPKRKAKIKIYEKRHRINNPDKDKARYTVKNLIRAGKLKKEPCFHCGEIKVEAHHNDYSKPLDIRWVCFNCHRKYEHNQLCHFDESTSAGNG